MQRLDELRRSFLIQLLGSGVLIGGTSALPMAAWALGEVPGRLLLGKSIYKLQGSVTIDGSKATPNSSISANSIIETGKSSKVVFAVGSDAFIMRSDSRLEISGGETIINSLRLVSGKLLSVFGSRTDDDELKLITPVATIGIRGTGIYLESEKDKTYVCTCYGVARISSKIDPTSSETVVTKHHDSPRYVKANAAPGLAITAAPVINHSDAELELIETLVGRSVPFAFEAGYGTFRSTDYK